MWYTGCEYGPTYVMSVVFFLWQTCLLELPCINVFLDKGNANTQGQTSFKGGAALLEKEPAFYKNDSKNTPPQAEYVQTVTSYAAQTCLW